jgi:cephalosporin-C deacetylase-like acetyl esterase
LIPSTAPRSRLFAYDQTPLNPVLESTDDTPSNWRRESVSIDAAYGGERFTVHLDLPKNGSPPYHAIVYFPGDNAFVQPKFEDAYWERFDYLESRDDIDSDTFGYLGLSGGAWIAPFTLAAEDRFKAAVLIAGGLYSDFMPPFAQRLNTPVLMLGDPSAP